MLKTFFLIVAFGGAALAQAPAGEPVVRSNTRLVLLDVIVTNDKGPVKGLTKDDFILEDKGKKQTISIFEVTEAGKGPAPTPLPPGVASNRLNSKGEQPTTASVILYDRINIANATDQAFVRSQVLEVLAGLKDTDRVGFYTLGFTLQIVRDFDEDAAPLARVAKALLQSNTVPENFSPEDKALFKDLADALSPMQTLANQARVNITYPAFRQIGRHLGGVPGRKNLLWIAAVFPLTFGNQVERRKNDQEEVDSFRNNLTEANIALYPVDPGGTGASFNQSEAAPMANEGSLMPGALRNQAGTSSITNTYTSLTGNQAMLLFADASGGRAYRNANDIAPALREILASASYSYTLGFYPDEKSLDGKVHELKVSFVKKPATDKAKAAHRKQYLAWGPKAPAPQMRATMGELLEDTVLSGAVGLMAVSNPDPEKPGVQVIDLRINAADIRFEPKGDQWVASFDIAFGIEGRPGGGMMTYSPALSAETLRQVMAQGMDVRQAVDTGGQAGTFRITLLDKLSGQAGGLRLPFEAAR